MKYCQFDGCTNKIAKGIYCTEHKRSSRSRKKKQQAKSVYHHENKPFYRTQAWKDMRQFIYEREGGHCQRCGQFIFGREHTSITLYQSKTTNCLSLIQTISCYYVQNVIQLLKTKRKTKKFFLRISIEAPLFIFKIFSRGR